MNRKNFLLALSAIAGLMLGMGQAQAKPNLSGNWKLNVEKSEFGPIPAPSSMTVKIKHDEPKITMSVTQSGAQGDMSYDANYTTDGKESTNTIGPMDAKSKAHWEGDDLVVETKIDAGGSEIVIKGKYTLSEDGKTITNNSHLTTPQGELDLKQVMEKQ